MESGFRISVVLDGAPIPLLCGSPHSAFLCGLTLFLCLVNGHGCYRCHIQNKDISSGVLFSTVRKTFSESAVEHLFLCVFLVNMESHGNSCTSSMERGGYYFDRSVEFWFLIWIFSSSLWVPCVWELVTRTGEDWSSACKSCLVIFFFLTYNSLFWIYCSMTLLKNFLFWTKYRHRKLQRWYGGIPCNFPAVSPSGYIICNCSIIPKSENWH